MSDETKAQINNLVERMTISDAAAQLGISTAQIKRYRRESSAAKKRKYKQEDEQEVLEYYKTHTMKQTQETFGHIRVKSLLNRRPHQSKNWDVTGEILRRAALVWGIPPRNKMAPYLGYKPRRETKRPIAGFWSQRLNQSCSLFLRGLSLFFCQDIIKPTCRVVILPPFIRGEHVRHVVLWVDMHACLRDDVPDFLRDAIGIMAEFQRWMYAPYDVHHAIMAISDHFNGPGWAQRR